MRETYVIFITEEGVFGRGLPLYEIDSRFKDTLEVFDDGARIVFVNGSYTGDDDLGRLMYDMERSGSNKMYSKVLSDRMRMFKETGKEEVCMSELLESIMEKGMQKGIQRGMQQGMRQGKTQTAQAMLKRKIDHSLVSECTGLPLEKVKRMAATL